jgi:transposase-like protein
MESNGKFEALAMLIATGKNISAAADELGITRRTAYRNASKPAFQRRVSKIRHEMTSAAVGKLTQASSFAVTTLMSLLKTENEPSVRLQAAKAILATLTPLTELGELRERIAKVEERQGVSI